ncbi:MAG: tyrosine--tRNA ligase [Candidatus Woesebacteria bacterium]|nr:tyrosine--tRNA ligase [Candidatus Woesebacteria bacterium]
MTIDEVLTRGVERILPTKDGLASLMSKKKIKLYMGIDPTGSELHIGHAVGLRKLAQFQKLGHKVIFLIGDFTGMIGDPSGKSSDRKTLTHEEVLKNAENYKQQSSKILNFTGDNAVEVKFNGEWLGKMSAIEFLKLSHNLTSAQIIERDMFQERLKKGQDIYMNEFLYPFMQAYDSVAMDVDLEIGGTDQVFNMLMGRKLMKNILHKEKYVLTVPLLTDGNGNKIGKTEGNAIGLADKPFDFYSKIMSLSDNSITNCFTLLTNKSLEEISEIEKAIKNGDNPMKYKKILAFELTKWLNDEDKAQDAQKHFENTFQDKTPTFDIKVSSGGSLAETIAPFTQRQSLSNAKELIKQNAVDINGNVSIDPSLKIKSGDKIKVGSRTFLIAK